MTDRTFKLQADSPKPAILAEASLHAELAAQALVDAGFTLQTCPIAEMPARLATGRFNLLVFGRFYLPRKTLQEAEAVAEALVAAVQTLLAKGGGVFFASPSTEKTAERLLASVGARVLPLQIEQSDRCHSLGGNTMAAYTTEIEAEFRAGIDGFWFPFRAGHASAARPVGGASDAQWRIVAAASANSHTHALEQENYGLPGKELPGFDTRVPLIVARDTAPGRLAVCGVNSGFHLHSPNNYPPARNYLRDGFAGTPSGLQRLLINLLHWLAAPSLAAGTLGGAETDPLALLPQAPRYPDAPPVRWASRDFPPDPRPRTGLIGARTAYSGGRGTVDDYVAKAKAAGHDFIVFLERFPEISRENWKRLEADCAAASDDAFLAVPGYVLRDIVGSWSFQYGLRIDLPGDDLLSDDGARLAHRANGSSRNDRLEHVHLSLAFGEMGLRGRRGFFRHADSPKSIIQNRFNDSIAVVTWQDGRLVDDIRDRFPMLIDKGLRLHPTALTLMNGPEEFDRALDSGWRNTILEPYVRMTDRVLPKHMAPELERWTMFDRRVYDSPRYRFDCWQYGMPFQCATGGPVVTAWTISVSDRDLEWREPDNAIPPTADLFRNDVTHFRLRLAATAEAGLHEILLWDGDRVVRRWLPDGEKQFEVELDLQHHQQMHLWLEARDANGATAVTGDYLAYRRDWCEFYCADRNNPLCIGYEKDADGYAFGWSGVGHLVYNDSMWGGKSPWVGKWWYYGDRIFPVPMDPLRDETGPFDGGIGAGGAGLHIKLDLPPQNPPERGLMVDPRQEMISPDVAICGFTCNQGYDPQAPEMLADNPGFGLYGMYPTRYVSVKRRATVFRPKPHALTTVVHHYDLRWKRLPQTDHPLFAGWLADAAPACLHRGDGETVDLNALAIDAPPLPWRRGDAIALWRNGARPALFFNESTTDLLLTRGHPDGRKEAWRDGNALCLSLPVESLASVHDPAILRIVGVGGTHAHNDPAIVDTVRRTMGLDGPPAYALALHAGQLCSQRMILDIAGEPHHGAAFGLPRCDLPMALPITVGGLHPERSAFLVDRDRRKWRPLGTLEGTAYAVLDTAAQDWNVFIGHPLRLSHPLVGFSLAQTGPDSWALELHNPTSQAVETEVVPAPEFDLGWPGETIRLAPGTSVTRRILHR